jgi:predicted secreted protein
MAINGNNILILMDGHAKAGTRTNEIQSDCEIIEIASYDVADWKTLIPGRKSWSFTVGFLLLENANVRRLLSVGSTYTIVIKGRDASEADWLTGEAILKTCKIAATRGNLATGSFSFTGTGPLT